MELSQVDLYDPDSFVEALLPEMFQVLRREAPVFGHPHLAFGIGEHYCLGATVEMDSGDRSVDNGRMK
jgi:cytochrome P450